MSGEKVEVSRREGEYLAHLDAILDKARLQARAKGEEEKRNRIAAQKKLLEEKAVRLEKEIRVLMEGEGRQ